MQFLTPSFVSGNVGLYNSHFAAGWSSFDFDGDTSGSQNCAVTYANVTQHYAGCWSYNLGADVESPIADGSVGPHVLSTTLTNLGLANDGSNFSRVRRITRFARW